MNSQNTPYKLIDLFAGAGGLSNGFEQTGRFEVIGAVEINKSAVETYLINHDYKEDIIIKPKNSSKSDIEKINFVEFLSKKGINGSETIVIGGPPCQGFSNANRQKNYLISGNNQLVKEFARAIEEIKPIAFLMENVKTINSDTHKFFVTEPSDDTKFRYSSEEHLSKITNKNGADTEIKNIWKDDTLILIQSEYQILKPIFEQILQLNKTEPIVGTKKLFSRLKTIKKKLKNANSYQPEKQNEIKEIYELVNYLNSRLESNLVIELGITSILTEAIKLLNQLRNSEMSKDEILNGIGPLLDLNQFLLYFKELKDEKLIERKPLQILYKEKEKIVEAKAFVKSYKVVDYLTHFFKYLGYDIDFNVLNASNFAVPQSRERFMILGVRRDKLGKQQQVKLPEKLDILDVPFTTHNAISDLENIPPQQEVNSEPQNYIANNYNNPLLHYYRSSVEDGKLFNHVNTESREMSLERFKAINDVGGKNFHSLSPELKDNTYTDSSRTQNTIYLRLEYNLPSPTVVNVRKSMWFHPTNTVALSIREAARLQSFKDDFIFKGTKDQQYQQVGNAVPPLLARAVAETILKILGDRPISLLEDEINNSHQRTVV